MNRSPLLLAAALGTIALGGFAPHLLGAQRASADRSLSFGVGGGLTMPTGDYSTCCNSGWNVGGFVQWRQPAQVFGIRADAQYHHNGIKDFYLADNGASFGATGNYGIWMVGADGVMEVAPKAQSVGWYLLGGIGLYGISTSVTEFQTASSSSTQVGFNAGGGLKFRMGGANLFVEGRWHVVSVNDAFGNSATYTFIPITAGLSW